MEMANKDLDRYHNALDKTWAVRYNPEYDGLILCAGTDSNVNLWFTSVRSSDTPERVTNQACKSIASCIQ